jgi:hypothetical protein
MSWKMTGEPKTRKLTRSLAEEFTGMTPAPGDRPINATRSAVLKRAFDTKQFRTAEWAVAYCEATKQKYRVNGKHTSTILSQTNGDFPKNLSVIVEEYHCDTLDDVAALYATFDTRVSARTTGDINHIYAGIVPELSEVTGKEINTVISGISFAIWETAYSSHPVEERAQLIVAHADFGLWFSNLLKGHPNSARNTLTRVAVAAAMFRTWTKSKVAASDFWGAVRDESDTKPSDPTRKLAKFLTSVRLASRSTFKSTSVSSREIFVKSIHAWNAWRDNTATDMKYYPASKTPTVK